jgi:23S rRNA (adenine2030-N6)-methyltransferase
MNYRHAFHAGNFADCMKHALLVWLLGAMMRKPTPLFVLDTHAGRGQYDLDDIPAQRTREAQNGILRLLAAPRPALFNYLDLVRTLSLYPGSPNLIRALLRPEDRLVCCELHPEDAAALRLLFNRDDQVAVHCRDGWEALGGLLPPKENRGLVLIDAPFEDLNEFTRLAAGLAATRRRFRNGVLAAWHPIKHLAPIRAFHAAIQESGMKDVVTAELLLRTPLDPTRLNGCGLIVVNPPYRFETGALAILRALLDGLGDGEAGAAATVTRLVDE